MVALLNATIASPIAVNFSESPVNEVLSPIRLVIPLKKSAEVRRRTALVIATMTSRRDVSLQIIIPTVKNGIRLTINIDKLVAIDGRAEAAVSANILTKLPIKLPRPSPILPRVTIP